MSSGELTSEIMPAIAVELLEVPSREDARVAIWRLRPVGTEPIGCIAMVPGFARRMRHLAVPALFMAMNGITVYRCDLTHHVGLSEGEIEEFTFTHALESMRALLETTLESEGLDSVGLVTVSLSMRPAVRLAAEDERVAGVLGLVGVVNTQRTLAKVFGEDHSLRTSDNLLPYVTYENHRIAGPPFWRDWHLNRWVSLHDTINDLRCVERPVVNICGSDDDWVDIADVKLAFAEMPGARHIVELPHAEHELSSNPVAADRMLRELSRQALVRFCGAAEDTLVVGPDFEEVAGQIMLERRIEAEQSTDTKNRRSP
jgi:acyl transferase